jgi:nucleotide-binding universal stress UspA family protein
MALKTIAVAVTGSGGSLSSAKYAIALAKLISAKLFVIYVVDEKVLHELLKSRIFVEVEARVYERDLEQQGTVFLERLKKMADNKGVACDTLLLKGAVSDEVINKVKELQVDLLVMGDVKEMISRADTFYDEGERIFHRASCQVLIVKDREAAEAFYKES